MKEVVRLIRGWRSEILEMAVPVCHGHLPALLVCCLLFVVCCLLFVVCLLFVCCTWAFVGRLFGSPLSLPHEHLTVWPATFHFYFCHYFFFHHHQHPFPQYLKNLSVVCGDYGVGSRLLCGKPEKCF